MTCSRKYCICLLLLFFSLLFHPAAGNAQDEFMDTIPSVIIIDSSYSGTQVKDAFQASESYKIFDKRFINLLGMQSLEQLLQLQSSVFIKNYGVNSLSTLSIRGASAAQSQVIWQGVPINSSSTGISDLSLFSTGMFDNITLRYSGNTSLYGSGNVAGALFLTNNEVESDRYKLELGYGSFRQFNGLAKAGWKRRSASVGIRAFASAAKNDFAYYDRNGSVQRMNNADRTALGAILDGAFNDCIFSKKYKTHIAVHSWIQQYNRAIPPALFEPASAKKQADFAWRNVLDIDQAITDYIKLYAKISFNKEASEYRDPLAFQLQHYQLNYYFQEIGLSSENPITRKDFQHRFLLFTTYQYNDINLLHRRELHTQNKIALSAVYKIGWKDDKLQAQLNGRGEQAGTEIVPFVWGGSLSYKLPQLIATGSRKYSNKLFISVQKSYRLPSLNELYFFPGGNPLLQPEYGWNYEAGLQSSLEAGRQWQFYGQAVYFNRYINDWIYWIGGGVWTPHNIASVYSRGWDFQLKINKSFNTVSLFYNLDYCYTLSTTEYSDLPNNNTTGKQIPYTPRYVIRNNLGLTTGKLFINFHHSYTGYRFTTLDESAYLKPYHIFGIQSKYSIPLSGKSLININILIHNLLNATYETVNMRPMPFRNYSIALSLVF